MKVSFLPKKYLIHKLERRNRNLIQDLITIDKDIPFADNEFLNANVGKLSKIAERNGCHLSFVRNEGFYNNSTKMNIGTPRIDVMVRDIDTPILYHWFKTEGSTILPENLQKIKNPFEIIKQDIKTILKLVEENKARKYGK